MNVLLTEHWPWWLGALALAAVAVGYFRTLGLPCGVSGVFSRVVAWRDECQARDTELRMAEHPERMQEQMMAEALAELQNLPEEVRAEVEAELRAQYQAGPAADSETPAARAHPALHLAFLASLAAGGLLAALASGHWQLTTGMGETYASFFGSGPASWGVLFAGGVLVGAGTQMAGGCTMGHGVTGNALLQKGSLLATASFFGTAVAVSFLLKVIA